MDEFSLPGFLDGLFDKAVGVFDRIADIEVTKRELSVQRDLQLFKQAQAFEGSSATGGGAGSAQLVAGVSNTTLLLAAGLGIVGLVLVTR